MAILSMSQNLISLKTLGFILIKICVSAKRFYVIMIFTLRAITASFYALR